MNTHWRHAERLTFQVITDRWDVSIAGTAALHDYLMALLHDLGVGLEIALYQEAVIHFLGGPDQVEVEVPVTIGDHRVGLQPMRLIAPGVALKITGFDHSLDDFETHTRRLLAHVDLHALAWVNINMKQVTFATLTK